jgi:hypothetical protein
MRRRSSDCVADAKALLATDCPKSWAAAAVAVLAPAYEAHHAVMVAAHGGLGFSSAEFLGLWTQSGIDARSWGRALRAVTEKALSRIQLGSTQTPWCGPCGNCRSPSPQSHTHSNGRAYLLSPEPALLHAVVARLQNHTPGGGSHRPPISAFASVHGMAASNATGLVVHPKPSNAWASTDGGSWTEHLGSALVRTVTIDDFLAKEGIERAFLIEVSAAGEEPLILDGMRHTLSSRRVELLRFSFSRAGFWIGRADGLLASGVGGGARATGGLSRPIWRRDERRSLKATVGWLHERMGYTCFLEAGRGALAPISGQCWEDTFETHGGYILCAHRPLALQLPMNLTRQAFDARQKQTIDVLANVLG